MSISILSHDTYSWPVSACKAAVLSGRSVAVPWTVAPAGTRTPLAQRFGALTVRTAILLFESGELRGVARGRLELARRIVQLLGPVLARGDRPEQLGLGLKVASDLVLRGAELALSRRQSVPLRGD